MKNKSYPYTRFDYPDLFKGRKPFSQDDEKQIITQEGYIVDGKIIVTKKTINGKVVDDLDKETK